MAEIENLSISVTANANNAANVINRFAGSLKNLGRESAGAAEGLEAVDSEMVKVESHTEKMGKSAKNAGEKINDLGKKAKESGKAAKSGTAGLADFWNALKRIAYYRFLRTVIKGITQAFKEGITNLYHYSDAINGHFAKAMDNLATSTLYLKNGLGTLVAPIIELVIPWLEKMIDVFVDGINIVNQFIAALSGSKTYTAAKKYSTVWDEESKKATGSVKKSVAEMKRTILGFDELNVLKKDSTTGSGSGSSTGKKTPNYSAMFEERKVSANIFGSVESALSNTFARIEMIVSGATLAVGALLALSGANVPLGLTMIAAGIGGMAIALNWDTIANILEGPIGAATAIVGGALLFLGAVALLTGHVPLGMGLILTGAAAMYTGISANWDALSNLLKGPVGGAVMTVAGGLLMLGVFSILAGHVPLGVGLLLTGAAAMFTGISANWDKLTQLLEAPVNSAVALISEAVLLLGVVAILAGHVPLGVGLLVAGAAGITVSIATNPNGIADMLSAPVVAAQLIVAEGVLMLGAIAILAGRVPMGIGLLIAGAAGIVTSIAVNPNGIVNMLSGPVGTANMVVGAAMLMLGAIAILAGHVPLGIGLMLTGAAAQFSSIAANWDNLAAILRGPVGGAMAVVSAATLVLGVIAICTGHVPLGVGLLVMGALDMGVTATANWDAIKEMLQGPLGTVAAIGGALFIVAGFASLFCGHTLIGVGLIAAGAVALGASAAANWNAIVETMQGPVGKITAIGGALFLVLGIACLLTGNIAIGVGLLMTGAVALFSAAAFNWDNLVNLGKTAIQKVKEGWDTIKDFAVNIFVNIKEGISTFLKDSWEFIKNLPENSAKTLIVVGAFLATGAVKIVEWLRENKPVTKTVKLVAEAVSDTYKGIWQWILEGDDETAKTVRAVGKGIGTFLTNAWTWLRKGTEQITKTIVAKAEELPPESFSGKVLNILIGTAKLTKDLVISITTKIEQRFKRFVNWLFPGMYPDASQEAPDASVEVGLEKGWNSTPQQELGLNNLKATVEVGLTAARGGLRLAGGAGGGTWYLARFAKGGIIYPGGGIQEFADGGVINAYANGTSHAQGSLFLAGEAGPEIVGHIGGRTEVLNKSQIASAIYASVVSAMAPAMQTMAGISASVARAADAAYRGLASTAEYLGGRGSYYEGYADGDGEDLSESIRQGMSDATARQNELLREQNNLLRQILDKEYVAEVSTAEISRKLTRTNRRAGTVVVPVGE